MYSSDDTTGSSYSSSSRSSSSSEEEGLYSNIRDTAFAGNLLSDAINQSLGVFVDSSASNTTQLTPIAEAKAILQKQPLDRLIPLHNTNTSRPLFSASDLAPMNQLPEETLEAMRKKIELNKTLPLRQRSLASPSQTALITREQMTEAQREKMRRRREEEERYRREMERRRHNPHHTPTVSGDFKMGLLVHVDTLNAVSPTTTTTTDLVHFTELSSEQTERVQFKQQQQQQQQKKLLTVDQLSTEQYSKLQNNAQKAPRTFSNLQSTVLNKPVFDHGQSNLINNSVMRTLSKGLPPALGHDFCKAETSMDLVQHLHAHHHDFCDLVMSSPLKERLCHLMHSTELDYLLIMPNKKLLEELRSHVAEGREARVLELIGSHVALFHRRGSIPVRDLSGEGKLFSYATLVPGTHLEIRRINSTTLEINGEALATLDPNSNGHVYLMTERSLMAAAKQRLEPGEGEELVAEPQLIEMPLEPDVNVEPIFIEEENLPVSGGGTTSLRAVFGNTNYANHKLALITKKMLSPGYLALKDMSNFISYGASVATTTVSSLPAPALFLKIYNFDEPFRRFQANALLADEPLQQQAAYVIAGEKSLELHLDHDVTLREYSVVEMAIRKSALINHLATLTFESPEEAGRFCTLSFHLTDEASSTNLYMSPDESLLLHFKDNLLQSISINLAASSLKSYEAEAESGEDMNQLLTAHMHFEKDNFTQLYVREMKFDEFAMTVLPLCVPKILKRIKAIGKTALSTPVPLISEADPKINVDQYERRGETTVRKMVMIGKTLISLARNKKSYTVQKHLYQHKKKTTHYIVGYDFTDSKTKIAFASLIDKKKNVPNLMSIQLDNPLASKKEKEKTYVFKLQNVKNPGEWYRAERDGLHFHFQFEGGNLTSIFINFVSLSKPQSFQASFESELSGFLSHEAYLLCELQTPVTNIYLESRLKRLLANPKLERQKAQDFFASFKSALKAHSVEQAISADVAHLLTPNLSKAHTEVLLKHSYISPLDETVSSCQTMLSESFSSEAPECSVERVLEEVLDFFAAKKNAQTGALNLYVSRLSCVVDQILCTLKK